MTNRKRSIATATAVGLVALTVGAMTFNDAELVDQSSKINTVQSVGTPDQIAPITSGSSSASVAASPEPTTSTSSSSTPTASVSAPRTTSPSRITPRPAATSADGYHGWSSGLSTSDPDNAKGGDFGSWRGSPVGIIGTWCEEDIPNQLNMWGVGVGYPDWQGDMDVAVGGFHRRDSSQSYAQAAAGAYDENWRTGARNLASLRNDKPGITYIRPFHEFNGDWYTGWFVTSERAEDYKKAFRRMVGIFREAMPKVKVVWSPNDNNSAGFAGVDASYPGDDVVDVIGVDSYDGNAGVIIHEESDFAAYANRVKDGNPDAIESWRQWAEKHGKPMSLPEWGMNRKRTDSDNPAYVITMNRWMAQHAAKPGDTNVAGKIVYDVYYNVNDPGFKLVESPDGANAYKSLKWGNNS